MSLHTVRTSKWTNLSITLIFQYGAKKTIVYHVIMVSFFFWKMIYKTLSCIYEYVYCLCFHNRTNKKLYHKSPFLLFFKELNSRLKRNSLLKISHETIVSISLTGSSSAKNLLDSWNRWLKMKFQQALYWNQDKSFYQMTKLFLKLNLNQQ